MNLIFAFVQVAVMSFFISTAWGQSTDHEFESDVIHIGVVVSDLEKSLEFYKNVLGMEETGGFTIDGATGKKTGLTGGKPFEAKILKLRDSENATDWKLISFKKDGDRSTYIQDDIGMQYITIYVKSLNPFLKRLKANDVTLLGDTPVQLDNGKSFVLIQDPDGIFIELIGEA